MLAPPASGSGLATDRGRSSRHSRATLSPTIEASVYFLISEALTNVVKHVRAASVRFRIAVAAGQLSVEVSDNGVGIAQRAPPGHGLAGLADRVAALDGTLTIKSNPSAGTTLRAQIPLPERHLGP
jgi:signal transduction histidine kinase